METMIGISETVCQPTRCASTDVGVMLTLLISQLLLSTGDRMNQQKVHIIVCS